MGDVARQAAALGVNTIPIVIGVTGHRDLRAADVPLLEGRVREIFHRLRKDHPHTPLLVLSPLAEGADRLVARIALAERATLAAPLPLPRAEYERDFRTQASRNEFARILEQAASWFELPLASGNTRESIADPGPARDRQYAQVGTYLVRHSQILIALWDGVPTERVGGTAQIVGYRLQGIPAPLAPAADPLDAVDTGLVYHVVTPRVGNERPAHEPFAVRVLPETAAPGAEGARPQRRCARLMAPILRGIERALPGIAPDTSAGPRRPEEVMHLVLARMDAFNRDAVHLGDKLAREIARSRDDLVPESVAGSTTPAPFPPAARAMLELYGVADALALAFQTRRRRAVVGLVLLALLAILAFEVYAHVVGNPAILALYPGILAAAFIVYYRARRREVQDKHLDYRALAEGLRVQLFWSLAGLSDEVADHYLRKHRSELEWIRNAIRSCAVTSRRAAGPGPGPIRMDLVQNYWVEAQAGFFSRATGRDREARLCLEGGATVAFLVGIGIAVGVAIAVTALGLGGRPPSLHAGWHPWAIVLMAFAPAIAAGLGGYFEKMAIAPQGRRYASMAQLFDRAARRLRALTSDPDKQRLVFELGREALEENGDWVLVHRERALAVPR